MVTYTREYFQSPEGAGNASVKGLRDLPCLLRFLGPKPDEKILDVGCGLGRIAEVIAGYGLEVTGIDISEFAIEQVRERCKGRENLEFICASALDMDFEGVFDKILCYHFVGHLALPDARILLKRMHSALKDGGTLVMGLPVNQQYLVDPIRYLRKYRRQVGRLVQSTDNYGNTGILRWFSHVSLPVYRVGFAALRRPRLTNYRQTQGMSQRL